MSSSNTTAPPPSPAAAHQHSSHMSPIIAVISLFAVVMMPMIFYTLFVALKCPLNPFRRTTPAPVADVSCKTDKPDSSCGVSYIKEAEEGGKEAAGGSDQCPVCLSAFAAGDEVRQLSACKHAFHSACIDKWLSSHSSCPMCRAAVQVKRPKRVLYGGEDDFRQGLPDAASLV